jgi:hypothetical protein
MSKLKAADDDTSKSGVVARTPNVMFWIIEELLESPGLKTNGLVEGTAVGGTGKV